MAPSLAHDELDVILLFPSTPATIGALLVGWGLSCLVLGALFIQSCTYFSRYPSDNIFHKGLVVLLLLLDTLHQALIGHATWHYNVANFATLDTFLFRPVWSLSIQVALGALMGAIVKIYYCMRVWRFSKENIWVSALIFLATLAQLGCALAFTIRSCHTRLLDAERVASLGTATLSLGVTTDIMIACALSYFLHKLRTGYSRSDTLINRLITHSVNTGMLTSLVSLTVLVLYNAMPMNLIFISAYFVLAKLYAVSCLATLNSRRFESDEGTDYDSSYPSTSVAFALSSRSKLNHERLEIGVHREISVISEQSAPVLKKQTSVPSTMRNHPHYTTGW